MIAAAYWWRYLTSPWLFLATAAFALIGVQTVVSLVWEWLPLLKGSYFLEAVLTEAEVQRQLEEQNRVAIIQAALVLVAAIPFLFWLKGGLAK